MLKLTPLLHEEMVANGGFSHIVVIDADNLTETTANTAQPIALPTLPKGWIYNKGYGYLVTPFQDTRDAAYNTTTFSLGDVGDTARYIASAQLNLNGTEITIPKFGNTAFQFTAATGLLATFGSQSGKSLSNINKGELHVVVQIIDTDILSILQGNTPILK